MEICRLCLSMTKNNKVLSNHELVGKIKECVSIEISPNENYSKRVCSMCLEKIHNWDEFKIMCLRSKTILETNQTQSLELKNEMEDLDLDNQNYEFNSFDLEHRTRRNSVIINRKHSSLSLELGRQWENEVVVNPQDDVNIPSEQLNYLEKINDINTKNVFLVTECAVKQSIITESNVDATESQAYSCDFCNKSFEYYTDYLDHQSDHDGEAVFHCAKCKMTFSSKPELVQHEKGHKIPCHICGTPVQKQSMKLHLNKHTDKFKCTYCSLTFTCAPLLREHITARHMKLKLHFCEVCGKDFATKSSLVLHLKIHSEEREYKCEKCDYAGRTSISLRIHMSKHENNTCICEYCSKIFKSNRNLNDHLKRVHCSEKKHSCEFCGMKFALRYLVEQHKRTHTGIHPYNCMKCSKTFARSDGLREHMKTHNRTQLFVCPVCSKHFLTRRGIKRHNCVVWLKAK